MHVLQVMCCLLIFLCVVAERADAKMPRPPLGTFAELEALGHTVMMACASPAVAALPQMASACAMATALRFESPAGKPLPSASTDALPDTVTTPDVVTDIIRMPSKPSMPKTRSAGMSTSRTKGGIFAKPSEAETASHSRPASALHQPTPSTPNALHRHQRQSALGAASDVTSAPATVSAACRDSKDYVLQSLRTHCNVTGCTWSEAKQSDFTAYDPSTEWFEQDVILTCDVTAVSAASNATVCASLAGPCAVGIHLINNKRSPVQPRLLNNAAALVTTWQSNASLTLQGRWDEQGLAAVLYQANALTKLNAGGVGLSSLSRHTLQALTLLRVLALDNNKLRSLDPELLSSMPALEKLSFRRNELAHLPRQLFNNCTALSDILLKYNMFRDFDVHTFHGLAALEYLHINGNRLTRLQAGLLQGLSALKHMQAHDNNLTHIDPMTFRGLAALEVIDISHNDLTQIPEGLFQGLPRLVRLSLNNNVLTTLPAATFNGLAALADLTLSKNKLTRLPPDLFVGLSALELFYIYDNMLDHFNVSSLRHLSALTVVDIGYNPALTRWMDGRLELPSELGHLHELWLDYTDIRQLHLPPNSRLKYVALEGSSLTEVSLAPGASADVVDISRTALRIDDLQCNSFGDVGLIAEHMKHMSSLDVLTNCMGSKRQFLDLSNNAENQLAAVRTTLANEAASFLMHSNATEPAWQLFPEMHPVRNRAVDVILVASPVECRPGVRKKQVMFHPQDYNTHFVPLQIFSCDCIPGYHEHNGVCVKTVPFVATPGGIVSVILATLLVAGLFLLLHKRVKKRLRHAHHDLEMQRGLLEYAETEVLALKRAWELDADDITLVGRIDGDSEGAFGAVWRGDWDGMVVAVKVLRAGLLDLDSKLADEFDREAEFLMRARHSNVVRFFGAGRMPGGEPFVVLELVSRGSLAGLLHGDSASVLDEGLKQRLALDIARGMGYIHSLGALHRDLKSGNVLVTENWRGKVADFGSMRKLLESAAAGSGSKAGDVVSRLSSFSGARSGVSSRSTTTHELTVTSGVGTAPYMAPEVLRSDEYGEAADVWAFGVTVWELVEQRLPDLLGEAKDEGRGPLLGRLLKLLEAGYRLQLSATAPAWAQRAVAECMAAEPSQRPSFLVLQERLLVGPEKSDTGPTEDVE